MSFNYTPSRKLNIAGAIEDATGMLMKNANRKVIIMLDKYFFQCQLQNVQPILNVQICRRLLKACFNLIPEYIRAENPKHIDLLLDRSNLYMSINYINLQKMLKFEREVDDSPREEPTQVQMEQKLGLSRLRHKIRQSMVIQGSLIRANNIGKLKHKQKIKYYMYEFWASLLKQLSIYANLFKTTNDISGCTKILAKMHQLITQKEFKQSQNLQIIKMKMECHQMAAQLYFQLCEFKNSINSYAEAINLCQQYINLQLLKENCPKVVEMNDLKSVIPWIMKLIILLYMKSYSYEYLALYSNMRECLQISFWLLQEVLRFDDDHQLKILVQSRVQETLQKYEEHIKTESEVMHLVVTLVGCKEEIAEYVQIIAQNDDYLTNFNEKFYLKFKIENLNRIQFLNIPKQQELKKTSNLQLYSMPKGSKTEREYNFHQTSKNYQSFTTQDFETEHFSKKLVTNESEHHNSKPIPTQISSVSTNKKSVSRMKIQDFQKYCKTEQSDYPQLDNELSHTIAKRLERNAPKFFNLHNLQQTYKEDNILDEKNKKELEIKQAVVNFKKLFSRSGLNDDPPIVETTLKQLNNKIKIDYILSQGCLEAEEMIKKKKQSQSQNNLQIKDKIHRGNKLRQILIKHSSELGLKRMKKKMIHREEESALRQMQASFTTQKTQTKPPVDEKVVLNKTIQVNLNAIKLLMDENQKEQDQATKQLRLRHYSHDRMKQMQFSPKRKQQKHQLKDCFDDLASTTGYLSTKNESTKRISSIIDLASIKRKLNHLETKKAVRYSEIFRKSQEI